MPRLRTALLAATSAMCLTVSSGWAAPLALSAEDTRHLISRTGFGASPDEIKSLIGLDADSAVDAILDGISTTTVTPMPTWVDDWDYPYHQIWTLDQTTTELFYTNRWIEREHLSAWWLAEMAATPSPLTERLVLFWSDHFASSFDAHENSQWTARQNRFFRAHAAGNFADLAAGILQDPAMLVYLDNVSNVKDAPNENLGREYLELFTLGEGRGYTQDDVRAAARMLTGTTVSEDGTPRVVFDLDRFDAGKKTIFGQTGRFDTSDLVRLTLQNPAFGPYIVEKLWLAFVSDQPDPDEVARLTQIWLDNDLEIKPLLRAMFLSDAFWDKTNRGRLVKSPIEMLIGTSRSLGLPLADARDLIWITEDLGQTPFMPPNVGGWPDGIDWINEATASGRATALAAMLEQQRGREIAPLSAPMMLNTGDGENIVTADPDDLRVGQAFVTYVELRDPGHGYGGSFTLADVGFAGHDWRSISFWMEHNDTDNYTSLYLYSGDCAPDCMPNLPVGDDDPEWLSFEPWDGFADAYPDETGHDHALMRALATHLPALIASTGGQVVYGPNADDPTARPVELAPLVTAAEVFAANVTGQMGPSDSDLVWGFSRPNVLGLAGLDDAREDGVGTYLESTSADRALPLVPPVVYASGRDWLNALPGTGLESARAAKTLLAVPRAAGGQRDELIAQDPEALLRHLILSPAYQVK